MRHGDTGWPHAQAVFPLPVADLFDTARRQRPALELPTCTGLRVLALVQNGRDDALPLKSREAAMIRHAVAEARGNVAEAARRLGISRATVYRKLQQR